MTMKSSKDYGRLRVLHIASWYPSKEHESLGNFIQRHVKAVSKRHESEVWFATPVSNESPLLGMSEVIERDGILERISYPRATKPGSRAVTRALLKMVPGGKIAMPDLVHLHVAFPAGRAARMLSERWGVPLVITEHWTAYHDSQYIPLWRRISMRRTAAHAASFCPVTDQLGEKMREFKMLNHSGTSVYTTVPNVVDTKMFKITSESRNKSEVLQILHVSSLDESQKNITGILHTLAHLKSSKPEFKFHANFVGGNDSEKLSKLRKYAASLGLTEQCITFSGTLSNEAVAKCLQSVDVLVLFSRNENFPCVISEAWASGVPVISTDVGGISEHLVNDSGRGILIKSEDEAGLKEAILSIDNSTNFKSEEIRKYATEHFSMEAVSKAFDNVYREALKSGGE